MTTPPSAQPPTTPPESLAKAYTPAVTEPAVWRKWQDANAFHADPERVLSGEAKPYAILIPPPNVTAALHLGHALNNTIQDILTRAHRMKGYETLWMPGTDHAGIATQTVVDKRLKAAGKPALAEHRVLEAEGKGGRERFTAEVQAFKDEYERRITEQLQAMGCSCDWQRQRFTMDSVCARAVREAFFRLFKDGLIERGKRLVNWDPVTQTALADDEVEMEEVDGAFYDLRYPLIHATDAGDHSPVTWGELAARGYPGADTHPDDEQAWVTVATTRPETYLGDVAVAVNPKDPRAPSLKGLLCELPIVGRRIPIIEDDYVVLPVKYGGPEDDAKAQMSTGFLKVTPAHDPNDYELGRRHEATIVEKCSAGTTLINVMAPDASISDKHGWTDIGDAKLFIGLSREDARKRVVAEFKARSVAEGQEGSLLERVRPHRHSVGHSYRSHAVIEPYLSDQWYCRVTDDRLRGHAQRAVVKEQRTDASLAQWPESTPLNKHGDATMTFHPARYAKNYEFWHDNLRDWCISRQLWWGHRIPVWSTKPSWIRSGKRLLEEDYISGRVSSRVDDYKRWKDTWTNLKNWHETQRIFYAGREFGEAYESWNPEDEQLFVCVRDPDDHEVIDFLESHTFLQDPDVLDTWFSSALWPLSTMGWPDADAAAKDTGLEDFTKLLEAFNPTSVLTTAREIITLWVSRMAMFNRYFLANEAPLGKPGPAPFKDVFIHAMIQDGEGRKMSKSLGNGVDPLDIIESHGADAMRFTLCQMTTQTQDVRMPVEKDPTTGKNTSPKFDIGRNLCNKLWNAARFALTMLERHPVKTSALPINPEQLSLTDRWMLSRLTAATAAINAAQRNYQFKDYADALYDLLWRDFCDWYLESIKPTLSTDPNQPAVLRLTLDAILRLMHPVMPFITETLYEKLSALPMRPIDGFAFAQTRSNATLCQSGWPEPDGTLRDEVAEDSIGTARRLADSAREVRGRLNLSPKLEFILHAPADVVEDFNRWSPWIGATSGVASATTNPPTEASATSMFDGREIYYSGFANEHNSEDERKRLVSDLLAAEKGIHALEARLANPGYAERAPAHLVQQTRDELAGKQRDAAAIRKAIEDLG
jgi:valyl-tRNA synthetase